MPSDVPHERIRETEDRSWTMRLLDLAVSDGAVGERLAAIETLGHVEDDRSVEPLRALVESTAEPDAVRLAAIEALAELEPASTEAQRREWLASGDPVLQRRAIWAAERTEADLLLPIARDPRHPLREDVLSSMAFGFDQRRFHDVLIAALDDGTPSQRIAAAQTLLWDQPVAAEPALLRAAADPDEELALTAIDTLRYYDSQAALLGLRAIAAGHERPRVAAAAARSANEVRDSLADVEYPSISEAGVAAYERWLSPVADVVTRTPAATVRPTKPSPDDALPSPPARGQAAELARGLADPNAVRAPLRAALRSEARTPQFSDADRRHLRPILLHQPDTPLREIAAHVFCAWRDRDALLDLALDRHTAVRKAAIWGLGELAETPDPTIAAIAWDVAGRTTGTACKEALHTYALHGERAEVLPRLAQIAAADERDEAQYAAVHTLTALEARDELTVLMTRLAGPPRGTWAVHTLLLDAAIKLDLPLPPTDHLLGVDSAYLQYSLAGARARRA